MGNLPKTYTSNQTGAIACLLTIVMWGFTVYGAAPIMASQRPLVYMILIIIGWVLLPFYIKLFRRAFIAGLFFVALTMCYLTITPILLGHAVWYIFARGLYDFTFVLFYLIGLTHTYFSYKSWKELLKN